MKKFLTLVVRRIKEKVTGRVSYPEIEIPKKNPYSIIKKDLETLILDPKTAWDSKKITASLKGYPVCYFVFAREYLNKLFLTINFGFNKASIWCPTFVFSGTEIHTDNFIVKLEWEDPDFRGMYFLPVINRARSDDSEIKSYDKLKLSDLEELYFGILEYFEKK